MPPIIFSAFSDQVKTCIQLRVYLLQSSSFQLISRPIFNKKVSITICSSEGMLWHCFQSNILRLQRHSNLGISVYHYYLCFNIVSIKKNIQTSIRYQIAQSRYWHRLLTPCWFGVQKKLNPKELIQLMHSSATGHTIQYYEQSPDWPASACRVERFYNFLVFYLALFPHCLVRHLSTFNSSN